MKVPLVATQNQASKKKSSMENSEPLWKPNSNLVENSLLARFRDCVTAKSQINLQTYSQIHEWSVKNPTEFWEYLWDFANILGDKGNVILANADKMPGAQFFPNGTLNYAENLLQDPDDSEAVVFYCEDKIKSRFSRRELYDLVSRLQQALLKNGLKKGDRVAAMVPNTPETLALMLAVTSIGAIWSSCSPILANEAFWTALDRLNQKCSSAATVIGMGVNPFP